MLELRYLCTRLLNSGKTAKSELPFSSKSPTLEYISRRWEDWILRSGAVEAIFEDKHSRIYDNINHHLSRNYGGSFLPQIKYHKTRSFDVYRRLKRLRSEGGVLFEKPKKEGFLHQNILYYIISRDPILGCTHHKNNPIGVPDIEARINYLN